MDELSNQTLDEISEEAKAVLKAALGRDVYPGSPEGCNIKAILGRGGFVATDSEAETLQSCLTLHRR